MYVQIKYKDPSQDSSIGSILDGTGEVPGSNPVKGEDFILKISNWIIMLNERVA